MPKDRVPVVSIGGQPLMPTTPAHARIMLRDKVARPRRNKLGLFYIQMLIPVGTATQPMALAIDPGSKFDGIAVASHKQVELTAQVDLPTVKTPRIGVNRANGKRIGQFGFRQVKLLARSSRFSFEKGEKAVFSPRLKPGVSKPPKSDEQPRFGYHAM